MAAPLRLAVVASHPIQYQSPVFRRLAQRGVVRPTVFYLSTHGVAPTHDAGFGRTVRFDVDLLGGFDHQFVANRSPTPSASAPHGLFNPALLQLINRREFDAVLVHGHAHASAWLSFLAARSRRLPYLLRGESHPLGPEAPAVKRLVKHLIVDPLVQRSGACLAIGRRNADFYRYHGAAEDRIVHAPYSVDNDYFAKFRQGRAAMREALLRGVGLDPHRPTVLFAAKLVPRKRPLDLLHAYRLMRRPSNLVLIGDGLLRDVLERSVASAPSIRLLGFKNQSELARWYAAADVFVLPSDLERWGLAVNEAMAAGAVPVVSDVVGCVPDLIEPGGGRTFPVGDVSTLASLLDELVADESVRAGLQSRGRQLVRRHSIDATAAGVERGVEVAVTSTT